MNEPTQQEPTDPARVGFRDIYRAVGESEARIVAALNAALTPLHTAMGDHEARLRSMEAGGSHAAQEALTRIRSIERSVEPMAVLNAERDRRINEISLQCADHGARIKVFESAAQDQTVVSAERRRLLGLSNKALGVIIVVVNFIATAAILIYNWLTVAPTT